MELWDVYDINRNKTGKVIDRHSNDRLSAGEYHLVTEAIIINSRNEILLTKRASTKQKYPLMWECTCGSCIKGENTLQAILRELKEELGLNFKKNEANFYKTLRDDNAKDFKDIYIFKKDIEYKDISFTDKEVIDCRWVTIEEFEKMKSENIIVSTIDFNKEDYEKCIKL